VHQQQAADGRACGQREQRLRDGFVKQSVGERAGQEAQHRRTDVKFVIGCVEQGLEADKGSGAGGAGRGQHFLPDVEQKLYRRLSAPEKPGGCRAEKRGQYDNRRIGKRHTNEHRRRDRRQGDSG